VWDLLCLENNRERERYLREAQKILTQNPDNPNALSVFGQWYAFRHIDDWAADFLERAKRGGAVISNLTLGRCYWRLGRPAEAHREFQQALKRKEAPDSYLELCMDALERQQIRPLLQDDTNVQRYRWRAYGEKSIDTTTKDNSRISSTRQMIAWWKFDEAQNEIVLDSSGNKFHGKLVGDAQIVSDPDRGNVLRLDGDGDYVDCGNSLTFDIIHSVTICSWVKIDTDDKFSKGWQTIIGKGNSAWRLHRSGTTKCTGFACSGIKIEGNQWGSVRGKTKVDDDRWHHLVGVYDGMKILIYVDGALDNSTEASGLINTNTYPVLIGENSESRVYYWHGLIDDVQVYNYALSEAEVREIYVKSGREPNED
jgi:hypothetical protein